jgi:hypothetical protein
MGEIGPRIYGFILQRQGKGLGSLILCTGASVLSAGCIPDLPAPPRERKEDIPLLASHFLEILAKSIHKNVKGFSTEALLLRKDYNWPGNVRELNNLFTENLRPLFIFILNVWQMERNRIRS